jgi:hypothetical protein
LTDVDDELTLRSRRPSKLLRYILWVQLCGLLVDFLLTEISLAFPFLGAPANLARSVGTFAFLFAILIFIGWMFQLHRDLAEIYESYSIAPGGALARVAMPIVNIWGIWNVFSTLADTFGSDPDLTASGQPLRTLTVWLYVATILIFLSAFVNNMLLSWVGAAIGIYLVIVELWMVDIISDGLNVKARQQPTAPSAAATEVN